MIYVTQYKTVTFESSHLISSGPYLKSGMVQATGGSGILAASTGSPARATGWNKTSSLPQSSRIPSAPSTLPSLGLAPSVFPFPGKAFHLAPSIFLMACMFVFVQMWICHGLDV
ncbi:predicted protein [Histoplasma capsulatum G186AR]|uniref:Uncharacterized protein n=1 Tax=Ajellomyces capsulatus (strain G186AR / H82 / ATCC MYA-2454 / RMSCC 2432) TaxID=447093 RepID=C0NPU4_AJECG|nr:uncharacterized protein HCBG_05174 [Histoplasma capsulatum G186AR]EEH06954.1 predicted protein [Histoplasma capsulatum G186AR]